MTYGTAAHVASLTPRFADAATGLFTTTTRPTLAAVETKIAQLSAMIDVILAENGYTVPITDADVTPMLDAFVEEQTASMVFQTNGSLVQGPITTSNGAVIGWWSYMTREVKNFLDTVVNGLERMGATRSSDIASSISYRDTDSTGTSIVPLFQRKAYGNVVKDWG